VTGRKYSVLNSRPQQVRIGFRLLDGMALPQEAVGLGVGPALILKSGSA